MKFREKRWLSWWGRAPSRSMIIVVILFLLVMLPMIYSLADPPSRGQDVCDDCHGGKYDLVIEDPTFTSPATIEKGEAKQIVVTVDVTADGKTSDWEFDMTVRLRSVNSKVTISAAQTFRNQRPTGTSIPYTWTKDVIFTITGKSAGLDTLRAEAVIDPDHYVSAVTRSSTDTITVTNQAPTLSTGYFTPASGPQGTGFEFGVTYTDANGDTPSYIRVLVGTDQYLLTLDDGTPDTILTGEVYSVSDIVLDEGSHSHHFEASDGDDTARLPTTGETDGPEVLHENIAPTLQNDQVSPVSGYSSDQYTFRVRYSDSDDQAPSGGVALIINGGERTETMAVDPTSSPHLRDGVFSNGEAYSITISLSVGSYTHTFNATDGEEYAQIGPINGPFIDDDPIIRVNILSPSDGEIFKDDEDISFESSYTSNVAITDPVFRWHSNITGALGNDEDLFRMLEVGSHSITLNVSSSTYDISDEAMVNILVIHEEPPVIHPLVSEYTHETELNVDENSTIRVEIVVNDDHPIVLEGDEFGFLWIMDGEQIAPSGNYSEIYFSFLDSGLHTIVLNLSLGDDLFQLFQWNITVNDIPAPIDQTGVIRSDLGTFGPGNEVQIGLPFIDRESRNLSVVWTVDDILLDAIGLGLTLLLENGVWANEGPHSLKAIVTNPDGTRVLVDLSYVVELPIVGDDDDDDDLLPDDDDEEPVVQDPVVKKNKIGSGGIAIIVLGGIALLVGVVYGIYAIAAPVEKKVTVMKEEVMDWDSPLENEIRKGEVVHNYPPPPPRPPNFPGGRL